MAKIRNEELDQLAGEVLPERTVLSAVPMDGGAGTVICSPNTQANSVGGNLIPIVGQLNQCGLTNQGQAQGIGLLNFV